MRRRRRIKIVATLGPSSASAAMVETLFREGADVFRINMSHASGIEMRRQVAMIREVEARFDRPIGILADLQGPKLRLGTFASGQATLKEGAFFTLDSNPSPGDFSRVHLPHSEILQALEPGHQLLIDDGKIRLKVETVSEGYALTIVVVGGEVSDRKGVSVPDSEIQLSALTDKDRSDLEAVLDQGVDWIALSFVQRPEDIAEVKTIVAGRAAVMAKIEKPQAVARLNDIFGLADGIMVARGDLGVEMPVERVPGLQKQITRAARKAGKPVIVATQMLESMIESPVPTRAEVSDVATAIFEGVDAIMLSAESAAGRHPRDAVAMMERIAREVESDPTYRFVIANQRSEPEATGADAIAAAARQIAETLDLEAIVCWTFSGATALRMARERPKPLTIALTPNLSTGRRLALAWGIHCVVTEDAHDLDDMVARASTYAANQDFARSKDRILIIAGIPLRMPGTTNMIRLLSIP